MHGFCHVTCMFLVTKKTHIDLQFPLSESHMGVLVSQSVLESRLEGLLSQIARRERQFIIAAKGGIEQCFNVITRDHTSALSLPWCSSCATTTTSCGSALGASIGSQCGRNTALGQSLAAIRRHLQKKRQERTSARCHTRSRGYGPLESRSLGAGEL